MNIEQARGVRRQALPQLGESLALGPSEVLCNCWGGGDRTKRDTENSQVVGPIEREKREKQRICPSQVRGRYAGSPHTQRSRSSPVLSACESVCRYIGPWVPSC